MLIAASPSAGAIFALLAAVSWGGGDFSGGMAVKAAGGSTRGALRVIVSGHAMSLAALACFLVLSQRSPVQPGPAFWGLGAGVIAGLSLAAFYIALARGTMGASAAVSGLLAAAIPAAIGIAMEGRPGWLRLAGFGVAAVAIWMIAAPGGTTAREPTSILLLAIGGGVGFGLYFTALKLANPLGVVMPMALARVGSIVTCLLLLVVLSDRSQRVEAAGSHTPWLPRAGWLWALGVAVLDTGGNLLYIAATRSGRLDVAAVLASLYPASTILLAAALLRERPGPRQLAGMALAVVAVVMVTL